MEWLDSFLVVGCRIAYYLQDIETCSITKTILTKCVKSMTCILSVSHSTRPEIMLLDSDNTVRIIDKQGVPLYKVESVFACDIGR